MVAHLFSFMISSCLARMVRTDEEDQALVAGGAEGDGVPCHFVDAFGFPDDRCQQVADPAASWACLYDRQRPGTCSSAGYTKCCASPDTAYEAWFKAGTECSAQQWGLPASSILLVHPGAPPMRDCVVQGVPVVVADTAVVQGVPVVVADTADYIRSAGVQPVTSLNAIRPPEAFCFGREKKVLKEKAGKCCGPSVAISPGYVKCIGYDLGDPCFQRPLDDDLYIDVIRPRDLGSMCRESLKCTLDASGSAASCQKTVVARIKDYVSATRARWTGTTVAMAMAHK